MMKITATIPLPAGFDTKVFNRSPQLLRDNKPARPGIPETIETVPLRFAIPLLIGKAHAELHEIAMEPLNVEEYGDVREVLIALSQACGLEPGVIEKCPEGLIASQAPSKSPMEYSLVLGRLHGRFEKIALDITNVPFHAKAFNDLKLLAKIVGLDWADVEKAGDAKRERLGGFAGHKFWSPIP